MYCREPERAVVERATDVRSSTTFLRQRWRVLAAVGAVGLVLGTLYATLVPAQLGSTSVVLLSGGSTSSSDGANEVATQVHLVLSTSVLEKAGRAVSPALSAEEVSGRIDVEAPTTQLIQIEAFSRRARDARALSQAVAQAYVRTLTENARSVTGAVVRELEARAALLEKQLTALQRQIDATTARYKSENRRSPEARADARTLARLTADQGDMVLQLYKVKSDIATSATLAGTSILGTISQSAAPAVGPAVLPRLLSWALACALLGAAGAAGVLLFRLRHDPRLRARDDLADAVGSGVLADVRSRPQESVAGWFALFEGYQASAVDAWAFRQVLRALAASDDSGSKVRPGSKRAGRPEHPRSMAIIAFSGDRKALAIGPQLAAFTASLGITTRLVVTAAHDNAAALLAACSTDRGAKLRPGLVLEARSEELASALDYAVRQPTETFDGLLRGSAVEGAQAAPDQGPGDEAEQDLEGAEARPSVGTDAGSSAQRAGPEDVGVPQQAVWVLLPGSDGQPEEEVLPDEPATKLPVVPRHRSADLTIVLTVADRKDAAIRGVQATAATVLAISPGIGTREELARLAVAVDDAGRRIHGIIVADPDPSDRTTGRRTLDERAREAPLPLRMTGISELPTSASEVGTSR
jgi:capsular polysaccharide biosynthesis protein